MVISKNKSVILISFILFLAFVVRLYGLTFESIWLDEAFSIYHAQQPIANIFNLSDPNPPLYIIILSFFVKTFGIGEFWVRLPSVIFGGASVLLIYLLGKRIFNQRIGLIASLILAFSTYNIFYSQEARTYALLSFLSLLSMYFFVNYFQTNNKINSIYYFIFTTLLLYAHYFSLLVLFVQNIFFIIITLIEKRYGRVKKWFVIQSLIFIVYFPTFFNLINQVKKVDDFTWVKPDNLVFINYNFSGGRLLHALFPLLLLYGLWFFIKNQRIITKKNRQIFILLLFWMTIPIIITVIYSSIFGPILLTRYVLFCSIPFYIIIAFSIDKLNKYLQLITLATIIIFSSFYIIDQIEKIDNEQWREVSFYIKSTVKKEDVVIVEPGYYLTPFAYYYSPKCFNNLDLYDCASNEKIYTIWGNSKKEKSYINYANRIIYVRRLILDKENESAFFNEIIKNFEIELKRGFPTGLNGTINVYLLKLKRNNQN